MTLFRMPLTIWAMFITAILQAFALPVLAAAGFEDALVFGSEAEGPEPDLGGEIGQNETGRRAAVDATDRGVGGGEVRVRAWRRERRV